MLPPNELSFEEILKFMLAHNGKVTNHELVKHFKIFLTNPDMRVEARNTFKKHVNTLALIKNQNNEKWLILKKKYMLNSDKDELSDITITESPVKSVPDPAVHNHLEVVPEAIPYQPPPQVPLNQDFNILNNLIQNNKPVPKPAMLPCESKESLSSIHSDEIAPKVFPRRKSEKTLSEKRSSIPNLQSLSRTSIPGDIAVVDENNPPPLTSSKSENMLVEEKISVKERKQMFNRMASEGDVLRANQSGNIYNQGVDEEDRVSLGHKESDPLDPKQKQWILNAARGDYHALAKMCKDNPKLVKTKDPFTTAMHWASKRGDENLVKLLAGTVRQVVNERSGYTPLHIAMQYRHENVFRLLVEVYDADPHVRDWSGKKPRQYLVRTDTSLSPGSYRKAATTELRKANSPPIIRITPSNHSHSKKEGFLRIGSLNVRVKKTTEAFSNFLGVGATRSSGYMPKSIRERDVDRRSADGELHKTWGSADNIPKDDKLMPPPMSSKVRRRGATGRKGNSSHSRSTPSTPDQPRAQIGVHEEGDSDSDSAAGFHSAWRQPKSSQC